MDRIPMDKDLAEFIADNEGSFVSCASDYFDDVMAELEEPSKYTGITLPWTKTHDLIRFRPGEVTGWAGVNGHGKSLVLGQAALWWMGCCPTVIGSYEMQPKKTLARMAKQATGYSKPSESEYRRLSEWYKGKAWIHDKGGEGLLPVQAVGLCYYAAQKLGAKAVILDSLMKIVKAEDDYNGQKDFVDRLCWAAKNLDIHIHLVMHMRKGSREGEAPDKFNVKGTGAIVDLLDNLLIVHRNKDKEAMAERGEEPNEMVPDGSITEAKQRHGEWEGKINLYFHKQSQQYHAGPGRRAMQLFRHETGTPWSDQ